MDNAISSLEKAESIAEKLRQRIVITSDGPGEESIDRALECGALACVSKPFAIEDVRKIKREWLEKSD